MKVLLLHGIGGGAAIWGDAGSASVAALIAAGHDALAIDLPGYGQASGEVDIDGFAHAALEAIGQGRAVIVGHSMGGMVAQEVVARWPEHVAGLVLACTSAAFGKADGAWQAQFVAERVAPLDAGLGMGGMAERLVPGLVGPRAPERALRVAAEVMSRVPEATYRRALQAIAGFDRREALARIAVPTLLVSGEHDRTAPPSVMQRMAERIAGSEIVCLEGAGHIANVEQPQEFNAALLDFPVQTIPMMHIAGDPSTLTAPQRGLIDLAADLGATKFAPRAAAYDRDARFPFENYDDLRSSGLLRICVPEAYGGLGADFATYVMVAAEIGRHCGSTALSFNMHVSSCLWSGLIADALDMTPEQRADHERNRALHYARIVQHGKIYSQPFSEGGAAAAGKAPWGTLARPVDGGYVVSGRKIFASLSGAADFYGVLCTLDKPGASLRDSLYVAVPASADGVSVVGDWDPLGMRGTVSRTLLLKDVFVPETARLMPEGLYFQAASRYPHMFATLSPTYMGLAQAAYDFTVAYLRAEVPGMPKVLRRMYPTKQIAVAQMRVQLEQTRAIFLQNARAARIDPDKDTRMRLYAAHYTIMENAQALAALAIRTCGGQSMLKSLPLERLYRDARCGSLMLPWTAELCIDRLGRECLYEAGERDEAIE